MQYKREIGVISSLLLLACNNLWILNLSKFPYNSCFNSLMGKVLKYLVSFYFPVYHKFTCSDLNT